MTRRIIGVLGALAIVGLGVACDEKLSDIAGPTPNFARTDPVRITVISEEDYNEFLRQRTDLSDIEAKYADLLNQLHQQTEAQQQLRKEAQALKEKLAAARDLPRVVGHEVPGQVAKAGRITDLHPVPTAQA